MQRAYWRNAEMRSTYLTAPPYYADDELFRSEIYLSAQRAKKKYKILWITSTKMDRMEKNERQREKNRSCFNFVSKRMIPNRNANFSNTQKTARNIREGFYFLHSSIRSTLGDVMCCILICVYSIYYTILNHLESVYRMCVYVYVFACSLEMRCVKFVE